MKRFRWIFGVLILVGLLGAVAPLRAQTINFDVTTGEGTSTTLIGEMFPFTFTGSGTLDTMTGQVTGSLTTSAGVIFTIDGTLGVGPTGIAFGTAQLQSFNPDSAGIAVIDGQINPGTQELTGNFVAGIPNRLGPSPFGFVRSTGTFTATMAP